MEPVPRGSQARTASTIPSTQLGGSTYPYSLAYDGLLQQRQNTITHGTLSLSLERNITEQLFRLEEKAAQEALRALHDLQGVLHHKSAYLAASATHDNWAQDRLPTTRQGSENLDYYASAIATIIERVVQTRKVTSKKTFTSKEITL
ncbi:ORFY protein [Cacao swollen shoot CE virus]|uniref:ORFY protein n=1 Tax=Cacao swollen shoot CE virus TaxID=2056879 RepID=A0A2H4U933_9VIRU|nr:ORFY protein [Cacao swollen shoot CE virus]ATZ69464.1 ORFY protein [Cacao swollen shoot CE virus]